MSRAAESKPMSAGPVALAKAGAAEPAWQRLALGPVGMLLAGVLHTASFAPTQAWPLQLLGLAWLLLAVRRAWPRPLAVAVCGLFFGLAWMASALWWLYISLNHYGHLPAVVSVLSVLALSLFLALYPALALGLWARWGRCSIASPGWPLAWASVWLLSELARGSWLSGFPWVAAGYAHTVGPFSALAPWLGVYGLAAVAAAWVAWWVQWAQGGCRRGPGLWVVLALSAGLLALWLAAPQFTRSNASLRVTLLQPAVPQDQKFNAARLMEQLDALAAAIEAAPPGLVVTPETAFPLTVDDLPPSYLERLQAVAQRPGTALLWGSFTGDAVQGYMNSMLGMTGGGSGPYVYGKRHLLPFGETIPPGFRGFVRAMNIPMDDQARGQHDRPFFALGQGLRPLICFEDLFAEEIAHSVAQGGATVLVNASNLAWFGRWMVQDQHLQFSIMRALEFQRPVVRSTNTGSTAVVDHRGQVLARLPPEQRASLSAVVEGRQGVTPLAWWMSRAGLWPLWVLGSLGLLGPLGADGWARRRALPHRHPHPHPAD